MQYSSPPVSVISVKRVDFPTVDSVPPVAAIKNTEGWCTGKTQRDGMGREAGGGIGMGNTCKSLADSCQCMAKTYTIL